MKLKDILNLFLIIGIAYNGILLTSCNRITTIHYDPIVDEQTTVIIYENKTNQNIKIQKWLFGIKNQYILDKDQNFEISYSNIENGCYINQIKENDIAICTGLLEGDSAQVLFNDSLFFKLTKNDSGSINFFLKENYHSYRVSYIDGEKNITVDSLFFIFTYEDYERAKPIN